MDNRPIGVFDSGLGGLPVLKILTENLKEESFVYLGDNENVPYGSRSHDEIFTLTEASLKALAGYGVKALVVACNTASLNFENNSVSEVPVFRLLPHLPRERLRGKRGCFLGTPSTVSLVKNLGCFKGVNLDCFALPTLASEIEKSLLSGKKRVRADHLLTTVKHFDFIYLGCTHYLYLKDMFLTLFKGEYVFDGVNKVVQNVANYLFESNKTANNLQSIDFVGKHAQVNERVFRALYL